SAADPHLDALSVDLGIGNGSEDGVWYLTRDQAGQEAGRVARGASGRIIAGIGCKHGGLAGGEDRKSTRLNSSHGSISYAVCCFEKKKRQRGGQALRTRREVQAGPGQVP